jgi:pyruvate kinase
MGKRNAAAGSSAQQPRSRAAGSTAEVTLMSELQRLRRDVRREGAKQLADWRSSIVRPSFLPAAENLAHYLALRSRDLRDLQTGLSERGLSSLGRCEAHVLSSLDAVAVALERALGRDATAFPEAGWKQAHVVRLAEQSSEIFGQDPTGPRTRIMVTLGADAAADPAIIGDMIAAGADCVRINCAHDDAETWTTIITHARAAAKALHRDCRILMDLAGPKIRIATASGPGKLRVHGGDRIALQLRGGPPRDRRLITITSSEVIRPRQLSKGQQVWIDDGKVGCVVDAITNEIVQLSVEQVRPKGVRIKVGKGLNFPDVDFDFPPLTDKDLKDLDFVIKHADIIGFSFVQRPRDINFLQRELALRLKGRPLPPLIIKVETRLGVTNLPALIVTAAGKQPTAVMIARGDLAVELGLQQLSETQEQLLWLCEAARVPVVWATQVLDGLVKTGIPSRAEATDAAMAQRAECVMLNKGSHALAAVRFLDNVLHRMDKHVSKKSPVLGPLTQWSKMPKRQPIPSAFFLKYNPMVKDRCPRSNKKSGRAGSGV